MITAWPIGEEGEFVETNEFASQLISVFRGKKFDFFPTTGLPPQAVSPPLLSPVQVELGDWWRQRPRKRQRTG